LTSAQKSATDDGSLRTRRLLLRRWRVEDREPFATMNADPVVMEHFPGLMERSASDAFVDRIVAHWDEHRFGLLAVEVPGVAAFIGYVGLAVPSWDLPFAHRAEPPVEIGWRLAAAHWGRGYAVEAASAAMTYALDVLALPEVLSWTVSANVRSRQVMERIGMTYVQDFEHPLLPAESPVRGHVLYRRSA
jgi:RimJ/RimL family protein N-acetyltransferase